MGLVYYTSLMDPDMKGNSTIMIFMEREFIFGLTIENMRENGLGIRCMEKEKLYGQTEGMFNNFLLIINKLNFIFLKKESINLHIYK